MTILSPQQRLQNASTVKVAPQTIPCSVTGWNTRDAVTAMDPTDAVTLDNWYPDKGGLIVRSGYSTFASGLGSGSVNTLAEYLALGIDKFLAACGDSIFDISGGGSGTLLANGFISDKWQTQIFNSKLFFVNGFDAPQTFDGAAIAPSGFTGPTVTDIVWVNAFKSRLYFGVRNSASFWYGGINNITGALTEFPLATIGQSGGTLMAMTTVSTDGGTGPLDLAVFIMSSGEVIIYQGSDPSDATLWSLIGRYQLAPPVNVRSVVKYGGESYLTTFDDHVPLQQQLVSLKVGVVPPRSKVSGAVQDAVSLNQNAFGWQSFFYAKGRRLIFNVPNTDGTFAQHVYNTSQDAWCRFVGMNATCWGGFNDNLYFGTSGGAVCRADNGTLDNGSPIVADGQPAWAMFSDPRRKRLSAIRPLLSAEGISTIQFGTGFDYEDITLTSQSSTILLSGSPWDVSPWDVSPWATANGQIDGRWRMAGGTGYALGFRLKASCRAPLQWLRTDVRYEIGRDL